MARLPEFDPMCWTKRYAIQGVGMSQEGHIFFFFLQTLTRVRTVLNQEVACQVL